MSYVDNLKINIPDRIKVYPEYSILLDIIKNQKINSKEDLDSYIKLRNKQLKDFIDRNRERATIATECRKKADEIDMHQRLKITFFRYL
ncbi:MAG: hypothetical protein AABX52_01525 [Nanoarchaeota archaeon]